MAKNKFQFTQDFKDFLGRTIQMYDIAINTTDYQKTRFYVLMGNTSSDYVRGFSVESLHPTIPFNTRAFNYSNRTFRASSAKLIVVTHIAEFQDKLNEILQLNSFSNKEALWKHLKES